SVPEREPGPLEKCRLADNGCLPCCLRLLDSTLDVYESCTRKIHELVQREVLSCVCHQPRRKMLISRHSGISGTTAGGVSYTLRTLRSAGRAFLTGSTTALREFGRYIATASGAATPSISKVAL